MMTDKTNMLRQELRQIIIGLVTTITEQNNNLLRQEVRQLKERLETLEHDFECYVEQQETISQTVDAIRHNSEFLPLVHVAEKTGVKHWHIRAAITDGTLVMGTDYIKQRNRYFVRESAIYDRLMEY